MLNRYYAPLVKESFTIVLFGLIAFLFFPYKSRFNVWGRIVLFAATYGILNDLRACYVCPEYFTVGHIYGGYRLVETLDFIPNALVWGIVATVKLAAYAGVVFCLIVNPIYFNNHQKIIIKFMIAVLIIGEIGSLIIQYIVNRDQTMPSYGVPSELQANWTATGTRNLLGYVTIMGGAMIMLAHYIIKELIIG